MSFFTYYSFINPLFSSSILSSSPIFSSSSLLPLFSSLRNPSSSSLFLFLLLLLISPSLLNSSTTLDKHPCKIGSPFFDFKYGFSEIHSIKGVDFCEKYSKRTCCNSTNFDYIKFRWFKMYINSVDISENCLEALRMLICYDCDSDIGQGIRSGLCPSTCSMLYRVCFSDFFRFISNEKLGLCEKNSIICSQAGQIFNQSRSFCASLGWPVNDLDDPRELFESIANNETINPFCFNGKSSGELWGLASKKAEKTAGRLIGRTGMMVLAVLYLIFG